MKISYLFPLIFATLSVALSLNNCTDWESSSFISKNDVNINDFYANSFSIDRSDPKVTYTAISGVFFNGSAALHILSNQTGQNSTRKYTVDNPCGVSTEIHSINNVKFINSQLFVACSVYGDIIQNSRTIASSTGVLSVFDIRPSTSALVYSANYSGNNYFNDYGGNGWDGSTGGRNSRLPAWGKSMVYKKNLLVIGCPDCGVLLNLKTYTYLSLNGSVVVFKFESGSGISLVKALEPPVVNLRQFGEFVHITDTEIWANFLASGRQYLSVLKYTESWVKFTLAALPVSSRSRNNMDMYFSDQYVAIAHASTEYRQRILVISTLTRSGTSFVSKSSVKFSELSDLLTPFLTVSGNHLYCAYNSSLHRLRIDSSGTLKILHETPYTLQHVIGEIDVTVAGIMVYQDGDSTVAVVASDSWDWMGSLLWFSLADSPQYTRAHSYEMLADASANVLSVKGKIQSSPGAVYVAEKNILLLPLIFTEDRENYIAVYRYDYIREEWRHYETLEEENAVKYGSSIAYEGSTVAVGSAGKVFIYSVQESGLLKFETYLSTETNSPCFGTSLAMDNGVLAVGSSHCVGFPVFLYSARSKFAYESFVELNAPTEMAALYWGHRIDIDDLTVVITAKTANTKQPTTAGGFVVYGLSSTNNVYAVRKTYITKTFPTLSYGEYPTDVHMGYGMILTCGVNRHSARMCWAHVLDDSGSFLLNTTFFGRNYDGVILEKDTVVLLDYAIMDNQYIFRLSKFDMAKTAGKAPECHIKSMLDEAKMNQISDVFLLGDGHFGVSVSGRDGVEVFSEAVSSCGKGSGWSNDRCEVCAVGFYSEDGVLCKKCPVGTYSETTASVVCSRCPGGFLTKEEGTDSVEKCSEKCGQGATTVSAIAQRYCPQCAVKCVPCAIGTYFFNESCATCPLGKSTLSAGALSAENCTECDAGKYADHKTHHRTCKSCEKGKFGVSTGQSACISCDPGFTTKIVGAVSNASCEGCGVGLYINTENQCTECHIGSYNDNTYGSTCSLCPTGSTTETSSTASSGSCVECSAGKFSVLSSLEKGQKCENCPIGSISGAGASECMDCAPGKFTKKEGFSTCSGCPAGSYLLKSYCYACSAGRFSTGDALVCESCSDQKGTYSYTGASECKTCSPGRTPNTRMSGCSACPAGRVSSTNRDVCWACGKGKENPKSGGLSCNLCTPGRFSAYAGWKRCFQCEIGRFSTETGGSVCQLCEEGYSTAAAGSTVCELCPVAHFSSEDRKCMLCEENTEALSQGSTECKPCKTNMYRFGDSVENCVQCPTSIPANLEKDQEILMKSRCQKYIEQVMNGEFTESKITEKPAFVIGVSLSTVVVVVIAGIAIVGKFHGRSSRHRQFQDEQ